MRSIEETGLRWEATLEHCTSVENLKRAVQDQSNLNPCVAGCRSVCWKVFLLFQETSVDGWIRSLRHSREAYTATRDHYLNFICHPEALAEISSDPLNDDPNSPWNTLRQDELMRAEIEQDVKRLPDEASYHESRTQRLILDVLFIHCKMNPERGGYRQGMHELLAPILYVVQKDAVGRDLLADKDVLDQAMLETLDAAYIEHDAYSLFSKLMERAQKFYDIKDVTSAENVAQEASSAIVERSKYVHEVLLNRIDPELALHLTNIEILPQIFLIRWIRLLFSREFPFDQFLVLWDKLFAVDPSLDLIDLVSCAMLLRIRWQLLQADYSVCLQLLLKYPAPDLEHGPHTFVDDAVYLQDHIDFPGGSAIIQKYTDRCPADTRRRLDSVRQRSTRNTGAAASPTVEQLIQGAAKSARGMFERSEKLGINQAVRDAVGELRRNMQGFNDVRIASRVPQADTAAMLAAMDQRGKQLAGFLNETVAELKTLSASSLEDKAKSLQIIEVAAAKVQFVQIYLEDSTMDVPLFPARDTASTATKATKETQDEEKNAEPKMTTGSKSEDLNAKDQEVPPVALEKAARKCKTRVRPGSPVVTSKTSTLALPQSDVQEPEEASATSSTNFPKPEDNDGAAKTSEEKPTDESREQAATGARLQAVPTRPQPPVPTRSTIAQSSFSWMLEPDESTPSVAAAAGDSRSPALSQGQQKRGSNSFGRERNAFLFGDGGEEGEAGGILESSGIFGLEPMSKKAK